VGESARRHVERLADIVRKATEWCGWRVFLEDINRVAEEAVIYLLSRKEKHLLLDMVVNVRTPIGGTPVVRRIEIACADMDLLMRATPAYIEALGSRISKTFADLPTTKVSRALIASMIWEAENKLLKTPVRELIGRIIVLPPVFGAIIFVATQYPFTLYNDEMARSCMSEIYRIEYPYRV